MSEVNKCFPVEIQDSEELWVSETDYDRLYEELSAIKAQIAGIRLDVITQIDAHAVTRAELAAIKAQGPVAWINNETLDERVKAKFGSYYLAPVRSDEDNTPLYAAPVAKPQVVMPEPMKRGDEGGSGEYGAAMIRGYNACLREVARLNAAPVQQVSVPDEPWTSIDSGDLDSAERFIKTQHGNAAFFYKDAQTLANISLHCIREVRAVRAMLAAAPAATAADTAQAYEIGIYGKAYDLPSKRRAYTYDEQPDNVGAYKLAKALVATGRDSHGDGIDQGLSLLNRLQEAGFGVFELAAAPAPGGE